jgi:hypothetical protein
VRQNTGPAAGGTAYTIYYSRAAVIFSSVMIEKFARSCGSVRSQFLDLNHTSKSMFLVSLFDSEVR